MPGQRAMRDSEADDARRQDAARPISGTSVASPYATVSKRRIEVLQLAFGCLVIAIVAALLGLSGVAGTAANLTWLLVAIGVSMALLFFLTNQRRL
jgi:uncharacterized membrane protein YtjA (UPF0391 family)